MKIISISIAFLLCLSIGMSGCTLFSSSPSNDVSKKDAVEEPSQNQYEEKEEEETELKKEDVINHSMETKQGDVTTKMNTGNKAKWPTDIPSYYSARLKGDVTAVIESFDEGMVSYTISFQNVPPTDMDTFAKKIDGINGWSILVKSQIEDGWVINAMNEEKDAMLMVSVFDGNEGMMQINYKK